MFKPSDAARVRQFPPCHELKCWPDYFNDVASGAKTFEVRRDDRGFAEGDTLWLREYEPEGRNFTGRFVHKRVTYILRGGEFGIESGHVVMGLA